MSAVDVEDLLVEPTNKRFDQPSVTRCHSRSNGRIQTGPRFELVNSGKRNIEVEREPWHKQTTPRINSGLQALLV